MRRQAMMVGFSLPAFWTLVLAASGGAKGQGVSEVSVSGARAPVRAISEKRIPVLRTNPKADAAQWPATAMIQWPELDLEPLILEDNLRDGMPATPMRVGVLRPVPDGVISPRTAGHWDSLPDGTRIWTLQIVSPGAKSIRVHFSAFQLPDAARLNVADESGQAVRFFSGIGPLDGQDFWTETVAGKTVLLEYVDPTGRGGEPVIIIDEISHQYREGLPSEQAGGLRGGLQPCQQDVNCHSPDLTARDSVAQMTFTISGQGTFVCTGSLLNDVDANTLAGYFITANHCLSTQAAVNTLQNRWFYQTVSCNGAVSGGQVTTGGTLLVTSTTSDFTFLRIRDDPELGQGLSGWTTSSVAFSGASVRGIHHPGGSWKRYSAGATTTQAPTSCGGLSQYIYLDWSVGIVEGGSSGSPLYNTSWQTVGTLTGACAFQTPGCSNPNDWNTQYGRFSNQYPIIAGPTNQSISYYLNLITPDDAYEPNDTLATAAALPLGRHDLRLVDFDDYFRISICGPGTLTTVATFNTADMDLDLYLMTPGGLPLGQSIGNTGTETVNLNVTTGDYIVHAFKDLRWGGNYVLEMTFNPIFDCDNNDVDDSCEIVAGVNDCDYSGILDVCESLPDCNGNSVPDVCDINRGTSGDCNLNGIPDECETPDCPAALNAQDVNSGGEASEGSVLRGSVYSLIASTAQRGGVGKLESASYTLRDGFWYVEAPCTPRLYGDLVPVGNLDGNVEVGDVLCVLAGYSDMAACPQGDIGPCYGDGLIEVTDVLAILAAYAGNATCPGPCVDE